jgi:hypothetical protein
MRAKLIFDLEIPEDVEEYTVGKCVINYLINKISK